MTEYVGIDFGNAMVKAAAVESPDGPPRTLRLSQRDPFLPLALRKGKSGYRAGWSAFSHRRRDGMNTVVSMRDQWSSSTLTASLAGRPQPVTVMLGEFLTATGARIQHAAKDPLGVVVTVPDTWDHKNWALPVAVRNAGWTPEAYVREWAAALAVGGSPAASALEGRAAAHASSAATLEGRAAAHASSAAAMLISVGHSGARATFCRRDNGVWKPVRSASEAAVSGMELRKRIVAGVAETVIRQARRDLREDPDSDQSLHDAVEAALYQLHRQADATVDLTVSGRAISIPCTRNSLATLADDFRPLLHRFVARVQDADADARHCPVIVWGELTGLLPIKDWLSGDGTVGGTVQVQSLDSLAAGAARLCAGIATGRIKSSAAAPDGCAAAHASSAAAALEGRAAAHASSAATAAVCPQCGSYSAIRTGSKCPQCKLALVTVWETLPVAAKGEKGAAAQDGCAAAPFRSTAVLALRGTPRDVRKTIETDHFRLGRHPQSEWAFSGEQFPAVSNAHAVIARRGERYLLSDLESTNGTWLNDARIDGERELKTGDEIRLGQSGPRIVFELVSGEW